MDYSVLNSNPFLPSGRQISWIFLHPYEKLQVGGCCFSKEVCTNSRNIATNRNRRIALPVSSNGSGKFKSFLELSSYSKKLLILYNIIKEALKTWAISKPRPMHQYHFKPVLMSCPCLFNFIESPTSQKYSSIAERRRREDIYSVPRELQITRTGN
jgi:hypothetical protein